MKPMSSLSFVRMLFACFLAAGVLAGCGGGGGSDGAAAATPAAATPAPAPVQVQPVVPNRMAVTVDIGPTGANAFNIPYVSVTLCRPGTTVCQTIDRVMVDSGSYGLRIVKPLDAALALPAVATPSGAAAGECGQFISGYTWGALVQADIKLGGKVAPAQSVQAVGQAPGGADTAPTACSNLGNSLGTVAALGANGILGVGLFREDCGRACAEGIVRATYYACTAGSCTSSRMPLAQQVANPVAHFADDNNGIVLSFPAVGTGGAPSVTGTLTFGIDTQTNNALGNATVYTADSSGNFTTVYKGRRMASSFIDSGSNGMFFNDAAIPACTLSKGFYCPPRPLNLSATITGTNGASVEMPFTIDSVDGLANGNRVGLVGGPSTTRQGEPSDNFVWGLPFFFGRKVYVGLGSETTAPYWAF